MKNLKTAEDVAKIAGVVQAKVSPPFNPDYIRLLVGKIKAMVPSQMEATSPTGQLLLQHLQSQLGIDLLCKSHIGVNELLFAVEDFLNVIEDP